MASKKKIGIVGSGLIGRSWAMLFAGAGHQVALYDVEWRLVEAALDTVKEELQKLAADGMLRGSLSAEQQHARITGVKTLQECVAGAYLVQECVPESLDLKIKIFKEMDQLVGADTILSSSTSCIVPSKFTKDLAHRTNCLVSHPVNPPYFVPLVEIVPAPWTQTSAVSRTRSLMEGAGQKPVTFSRELPGFGLNRLQYTLLNECFHLVSDGVLSAADVDTLMTAGLGPRYAWMGPLETAHLNAEGLGSYIERYGATIKQVSATLKGPADWSLPAASSVVEQMDQLIPLDRLKERRVWRDERLMALAHLRRTKEKTD